MPHRSPEWQDAFLTAFVKRLAAEPSTALNPACLSQLALRNLLGDILSELETRGIGPCFEKGQVKTWLLETGLLTAIPVEYGETKRTLRTTFYTLDLARRRFANASPYELLQAYDADGVICYFSAIAFHSLSTQPPMHHHIAILHDYREKTDRKTASTALTSLPRKYCELGTRLFKYAEVPYYKTSRERRLVPGIQTRYLGPNSLIRITTLEQTLLDVLHRPLSCGGPAVAFEAWEQGLSNLNENRLTDHLIAMEHLPTMQRLGYMLDTLDFKPQNRLASVLESCVARLEHADPSAYRQLFPGVKYENLRTPWLVYGP